MADKKLRALALTLTFMYTYEFKLCGLTLAVRVLPLPSVVQSASPHGRSDQHVTWVANVMGHAAKGKLRRWRHRRCRRRRLRRGHAHGAVARLPGMTAINDCEKVDQTSTIKVRFLLINDFFLFFSYFDIRVRLPSTRPWLRTFSRSGPAAGDRNRWSKRNWPYCPPWSRRRRREPPAEGNRGKK
jgi:hypothetical protein